VFITVIVLIGLKMDEGNAAKEEEAEEIKGHKPDVFIGSLMGVLVVVVFGGVGGISLIYMYTQNTLTIRKQAIEKNDHTTEMQN
jgi:hypothetical protein